MAVRAICPSVFLFLGFFALCSAGAPLSISAKTLVLAKNAAHARTKPAQAPTWTRKVMHTRMLGADIRTDVRRKGNHLEGVVYVKLPFSKRRVYHFKGRITGNTVVAAHHSGHRFKGTITPDNHVRGILTTSKGRTIPLNLKMP